MFQLLPQSPLRAYNMFSKNNSTKRTEMWVICLELHNHVRWVLESETGSRIFCQSLDVAFQTLSEELGDLEEAPNLLQEVRKLPGGGDSLNSLLKDEQARGELYLPDSQAPTRPPPKKKEGRKELRRKKEEKKCTFLFVLVYGVQWRDQQKMKRWGWGGRQGIDQEESYI